MTTTTTRSSAIAESAAPRDVQSAPLTRPWQRSAGRLRWWAALVVVGGIAVASGGLVYLRSGASSGPVDTFIVAPRNFTISLHEKGELKAAKSIDVKCEVEGRSTIIQLVPEGTEVQKGDLLVKLSSEAIDDRVRSEEIKEANAKAAAEAAVKEHDILVDEQASAIRKAELALQNARIELEKYTEGDWKEQSTDADLEVQRAEEVLSQRKDELKDAEELYELEVFQLDERLIEPLRPTVSSAEPQPIPPELGRIFAQHERPLSADACIAADKVIEQCWLITDTAKRYSIRNAENLWRVYDVRNFITARELRDKRFAVLEAEFALEKANLRKKVLHEYSHRKDLQQKQSDVDEAIKELERTRKSAEAQIQKSLANRDAKAAEYEFIRQQLEKFRQQQAKTEIHAPAAGIVVYETGEGRWDNRQIAEGAEVYERQTIIKLPDTEVMQVTVRIHESKANKVEVGQKVRVEVEGMPGLMLDGEVTNIAPLADSQNRWLNPELREYETEITLKPNPHLLKPGVTARAEIMIDEVRNALAVPVQAAVTKHGRRFVFRGRGDAPEPVEVKLGRSNQEFVAVLEGLAAGDAIRLGINEDDLQRIEELDSTEADPTDAEAVTEDSPASNLPPAEMRQRRSGGARGARGQRPPKAS